MGDKLLIVPLLVFVLFSLIICTSSYDLYIRMKLRAIGTTTEGVILRQWTVRGRGRNIGYYVSFEFYANEKSVVISKEQVFRSCFTHLAEDSNVFLRFLEANPRIARIADEENEMQWIRNDKLAVFASLCVIVVTLIWYAKTVI